MSPSLGGNADGDERRHIETMLLSRTSIPPANGPVSDSSQCKEQPQDTKLPRFRIATDETQSVGDIGSFPVIRSVLWDRTKNSRGIVASPPSVVIDTNSQTVELCCRANTQGNGSVAVEVTTIPDTNQISSNESGSAIMIHAHRYIPLASTESTAAVELPGEKLLNLDAPLDMKQMCDDVIRSCSRDDIPIPEDLVAMTARSVDVGTHGEDIDQGRKGIELLVVRPAISFTITEVPKLPILETALARRVAAMRLLPRDTTANNAPEFGYLTLDRTRKAVLMHRNDVQVATRPIVGIWVAQTSKVTDPFVWAACLRYIFSTTITDRATVKDGSFLVAMYRESRRLPYFYEALPCKSEEHVGNPPLTLCTGIVAHSLVPSEAEQDAVPVKLTLRPEPYGERLNHFLFYLGCDDVSHQPRANKSSVPTLLKALTPEAENFVYDDHAKSDPENISSFPRPQRVEVDNSASMNISHLEDRSSVTPPHGGESGENESGSTSFRNTVAEIGVSMYPPICIDKVEELPVPAPIPTPHPREDHKLLSIDGEDDVIRSDTFSGESSGVAMDELTAHRENVLLSVNDFEPSPSQFGLNDSKSDAYECSRIDASDSREAVEIASVIPLLFERFGVNAPENTPVWNLTEFLVRALKSKNKFPEIPQGESQYTQPIDSKQIDADVGASKDLNHSNETDVASSASVAEVSSLFAHSEVNDEVDTKREDNVNALEETSGKLRGLLEQAHRVLPSDGVPISRESETESDVDSPEYISAKYESDGSSTLKSRFDTIGDVHSPKSDMQSVCLLTLDPTIADSDISCKSECSDHIAPSMTLEADENFIDSTYQLSIDDAPSAHIAETDRDVVSELTSMPKIIYQSLQLKSSDEDCEADAIAQKYMAC